jgi:N-methylhydantoinase B/oxoprolinase/acetone carboxylase alpha subunit
MTNTRLTDPEVLEFRYPVLLEVRADAGAGMRAMACAAPSVSRLG